MPKAPKTDTADLTSGAIGPKLWSLSWPMMLSVFFYTLYNIVDAFWVSKLSPEAIAAVSISQITLFLMIALGFGITVGSGVVMSMDIGAKNKPEAERVLGQSFVLTAIAGVLFTGIALLFREQLLTLSGANGAIFAPAMEYFTITAAGSIFFFTLITIMFAFNAQGDTFTLTKLFAVSTLVNGILDPVLIFGWWGMPALGISGAAVATVTSQILFIIIALTSLSRPARSVQFHFQNLTLRWESVKRVLKIGIPAALTQVINPVGMAVLTYVCFTAFQEPGTIAFSLGFRIEFFAYLPAIGYGFGAMAMMGQSMGAENLQRAKDILRMAILYASCIAMAMGVAAAVFAEPIIGIFTTDPTVTALSLSYMRSVALSYGFLAAMMVEASAFQAMGKSWPGFWIMFIRFLVIALPLSYLLCIVWGWSIMGLWGAIIAGNVLAAGIGYVWIWSALNKFDFADVEKTTHMHAS